MVSPEMFTDVTNSMPTDIYTTDIPVIYFRYCQVFKGEAELAITLLLVALAVFTNLLFFYVIARTATIRTTLMVLFCNLDLCDLLYAIVRAGILGSGYSCATMIPAEIPTKTSTFTIVVIATERFYAICQPHLYSRRKLNDKAEISALVLSTWVLGILMSVVPLLLNGCYSTNDILKLATSEFIDAILFVACIAICVEFYRRIFKKFKTDIVPDTFPGVFDEKELVILCRNVTVFHFSIITITFIARLMYTVLYIADSTSVNAIFCLYKIPNLLLLFEAVLKPIGYLATNPRLRQSLKDSFNFSNEDNNKDVTKKPARQMLKKYTSNRVRPETSSTSQKRHGLHGDSVSGDERSKPKQSPFTLF
uniref:Sphingosine 1-phosphate receptor 2-like n=1 Tax=Saccoglossus kowalevskii TaxID=10224 RepID=A0ABM0N128_SACKO|nr:PREDICTED: sphingosine 1-phosphate receptor 2-like [Saccoglossus kowalevskii]